MQVLSRKQAIAAGLAKYFTGKPCKQGHFSERRVSGRSCVACANSVALAWAKVNKQRIKEIQHVWNTNNRVKTAERVRKYRFNNPEKVKISVEKWREANKGHHKTYMNIAAVMRNTAKIQRTPSWLNAGHELEIQSIYKYCQALRGIGLSYEVDHIVPLRGKDVSGLHVPWNLQVIPAAENRSKGNR